MSKVRAPKNEAQATALYARFAELDGKAAGIEERRTAKHARIDAVADAMALPVRAEMAEIAGVLETWFGEHGAALLPKGRKSLMLGGCRTGTKVARGKLVHGFAEDEQAVAALRDARLGAVTLNTRYYLNRPAISQLLEGGLKKGRVIAGLGFRIEGKGEQFFIERADQAGMRP